MEDFEVPEFVEFTKRHIGDPAWIFVASSKPSYSFWKRLEWSELYQTHLDHCLTGPSREYFLGMKDFYVWGARYSEEEEYWKHPLVVAHNIPIKLKAIVQVDDS